MAPTLFMKAEKKGPEPDQNQKRPRPSRFGGHHDPGKNIHRARVLQASTENKNTGHGYDGRMAKAGKGSGGGNDSGQDTGQ